MTNVVVMLADQLRADSLGCYGNDIVRTPHIDGLAAGGTRFAAAFAQHPQCVPSRSSLITGRYPHVNGSTSNDTAMADGETTLPEHLQRHGYFTGATGKIHLFPHKEQAAYQWTMLCGGQTSNRSTPDLLRRDYLNWLHAHGYSELLARHYANRALPAYRENFQAVTSPLPVAAYYDGWTGDRSVAFIEEQAAARQPFYLFVGFPNPHNPFEPPEPYASLYDPAQMPIPESFHSDLSAKPPQHLVYKQRGRANLGLNFEHLTAEKLQRVIAHYYASVTLVDDQVGKIVAALAETGLLDDTIVIVLSDHGELLGHHGMLLKSTDAFPMLYDVSLHVPWIMAGPGVKAGQVVAQAVELVDYLPTVCDLLGLPGVPEAQGISLAPALRGEPQTFREFVFAESGAVKMLRGSGYKLVVYPGQPYGELYDLTADPQEMHNLYALADYAGLRAAMQGALLEKLIMQEGPLHGASKRGPAYWREQYRLPFADDAAGD